MAQPITFDLRLNQQTSVIRAFNPYILDDIYGANPSLISLDLNANGLRDYVTASASSNQLFIYFDQPDFDLPLYDPATGPQLIVSGSSAGFLGECFEKGDVNGDGIDDLIVGDYRGGGGEGQAFIILGRSSLPTTGTVTISSIANTRISFEGFAGHPREAFGKGICVSDVNGDGKGDVVISAPGEPFNGNTNGRVVILYGRHTWPGVIEATTQSSIVITGSTVFDHAGYYLRSGNWNADAYGDIVITSPYYPGPGAGSERGKAWVIYGRSDLPSTINLAQGYPFITSFEGSNQADEMAYAQKGDINGDGIDDLILTAARFDLPNIFPATNNCGKVYIMYGPIAPGGNHSVETYANKTTIYPTPDASTMTYQFISNKFGQSVAVADINGDGKADLLIGAKGYSRLPYTGSQTNEGGAFIVLGGSSLPSTIFNPSQAIVFLADNGAGGTVRNVEFGFGTSLLRIGQHNVAAIADPPRTSVYLFRLPSLTSANELSNEMPERPWLHQNYPNPFNPSTTISYDLAKSGFVTLKVINLIAEEVASLVDMEQHAGRYEVRFDTRGLSSGVYLYRLQAGDFSQTRKLIIMK